MASIEIHEALGALQAVLPHLTVCGAPVGFEIEKKLDTMSWEIAVILKVPNMWKPGSQMVILPPVSQYTQGPPAIQAIHTDTFCGSVSLTHEKMAHCHPAELKDEVIHHLRDALEDMLADQIKFMGMS